MFVVVHVSDATYAYLRAVATAWDVEGRPDGGESTTAEVAAHLIESALLEDHVFDERSQTWIPREDIAA